MEAGLIRPLASRWRGAVLVCGKCSKKAGGGFGSKGRTRLAKILRKALEGGRKRKAAFGVIETKCLGVCPRKGVTVIDASRPQRWLVVPAGSDPARLVEWLLIDEAPRQAA